MNRTVSKPITWLTGGEVEGVSVEQHTGAKLPLSPLHPTPNGNQPCPVLSFFKKFNFEIILD